MQLRKYRWSRHYESAEEELFDFLKVRNIQAERQDIEAGDSIAPRAHDRDVQIFCAEGSVSLRAGGKVFSLQPGDSLDLPANTIYEATAGMTGVVYYESQPR